jgi:hypothetical protein
VHPDHQTRDADVVTVSRADELAAKAAADGPAQYLTPTACQRIRQP